MDISLEPVESSEPTEEPLLGEQIRRITQEWGSFANLNEESLEEAAEREASGSEVSESNDDASESEETSFEKLRIDLAQKVSRAFNEAALGLDFVSLLVSSVRPQQGASTMSSALKSQIPMGTLSADTLGESAQVRGLDLRSAPGWKILAFDDTSNILSKARSRLEEEVKFEEKFWNEALDHIEAGEVLTRQSARYRRSMAGSLGIKYGYGDSGSTYSDKGKGMMIRGTEGHLEFRPDAAPIERLVRVTISRGQGQNPEATSESSVLHPIPGQSEIAQARFWLFEQELMYQLVQEARKIVHMRVSIRDDQIICELHDGTITIDYVLFEEAPEKPETLTSSAAICHCFHLLLVNEFHKNYEKWHGPQKPLDSRVRKDVVEGHVLTPVMAHVMHSISVQRAYRLCQILIPEMEWREEQVSTEKSTNNNPLSVILSSPSSVHIITCEKFKAELTVLSPLDEGPTYLWKMNESKAEFSDMAELEAWLKWIA